MSVFLDGKDGYDAYGIDINPFLVWSSRRQARQVLGVSRADAKAMFKVKNMWDVDLSPYDAVALYGIGSMFYDLKVICATLWRDLFYFVTKLIFTLTMFLSYMIQKTVRRVD